MSKSIRAILIGFVIALIVGFGLGYAMSGAGQDNSLLAAWCGLFVGGFVAYILGNLSGNRSVANASEEDRQAALARKPPLGKALLYVWRDGFVAKLAGLNVAVDGRDVAQLKAPRFTVVAIPAGAHKLTAQFGGLAGKQNNGGEFAFDAPAGGAVAIRINVQMGMLQGTVLFSAESDIEAARRSINAMPMTPPDVAEL